MKNWASVVTQHSQVPEKYQTGNHLSNEIVVEYIILKIKILSRSYVWYKYSRILAPERHTRVIRSANNAEAKGAAFLHQYDILQQNIVTDAYFVPYKDNKVIKQKAHIVGYWILSKRVKDYSLTITKD